MDWDKLSNSWTFILLTIILIIILSALMMWVVLKDISQTGRIGNCSLENVSYAISSLKFVQGESSNLKSPMRCEDG